MKGSFFFLVALLFSCCTFAADQATPRLTFVKEFVDGLIALESIRDANEKELKQIQRTSDRQNSALANMLHFGTQMNIELSTRVAMLNGMRLNPPFETLPGSLQAMYKQKMQVYTAMMDIATQMMSGPKPGVDYGAMAAEMPRLRAVNEGVDATILKTVMPMTFFALVDEKPDADGKLTFLNITKAQRRELTTKISRGFGSKLKLKAQDQNNIVTSAVLLNDGLMKKHCADER